MSIPDSVFLVLALFLVRGVIGDPPKTRGEAVGSQTSPDEDQCRRKTFMDRGKVRDNLQQLKPDTDMQTVLDILGNAVTEGIRLCSKRNIPLDDFEIVSGKCYICGGGGNIETLQSLYATAWKYLGNKGISKGSNDPLEFKITFQFTAKINVQYYYSYMKIPMALGLRGPLHGQFDQVPIDLTLFTDSYTTLLDKLNNQQCFLHVKRFEASIPGMNYYMKLKNHKLTYDMNRPIITDVMLSKVEDIREDVKQKVKAAFYEGLVDSGEWVCLDDYVKGFIDKKTTSTRKAITSEKFKSNCNEDNTSERKGRSFTSLLT